MYATNVIEGTNAGLYQGETITFALGAELSSSLTVYSESGSDKTIANLGSGEDEDGNTVAWSEDDAEELAEQISATSDSLHVGKTVVVSDDCTALEFRYDVSKASVVLSGDSTFDYDGTAHALTFEVKLDTGMTTVDEDGNDTALYVDLEQDTHYSVEYYDSEGSLVTEPADSDESSDAEDGEEETEAETVAAVPTDAGNYTVYVVACGDDSFGKYGASFTLTINKVEHDFDYRSAEVSKHVNGAVNNAIDAGTLSDLEGNMSYASSDESVATVEDDGAVLIVGAGTATITATAAATSNYVETARSYTLKVSGHSCVPTIVWADDYTATLVNICSTCGDESATETDVTVTITTDSDGSTVFTASASYEGTEYTDTKTISASTSTDDTTSTTNTVDATVSVDESGNVTVTESTSTDSSSSTDGSTTTSYADAIQYALITVTNEDGITTSTTAAVSVVDGVVTVDTSGVTASSYTVTIVAEGYEDVVSTVTKTSSVQATSGTVKANTVNSSSSSSSSTTSGSSGTTAKKANTLTVKAKAVSVKGSYDKKKKTNKKAIAVAASKFATVSKAQGKVTYKLAKAVAGVKMASTGKVTLAKGKFKKGKTVVLKVTVTAAGNSSYKAGSKTITVKIKLK